MRESGSVTLTWSSARTPALSREMMRYASYLYQPARQGSAGRFVVDAGTCQDRRRTLIPRRFSQYIVVAGCWQRDDAELDCPRYSCSRSGACQVGKLATLCRSGAVPRTLGFASSPQQPDRVSYLRAIFQAFAPLSGQRVQRRLG